LRAAALVTWLLAAGGGGQDDPVMQAVAALRAAGELEAAAEKLREALARSPPTRPRAEARVELLLALQEQELALGEGRHWLEVYPDSGMLHVWVGDALFIGRSIAEAGTHYALALALGDEAAAELARGRTRAVLRERELAQRAARHESRAVWVVAGSAAGLALLVLLGIRRLRPRTG
jgi:tetratricopeptide (TPR) repeat protein